MKEQKTLKINDIVYKTEGASILRKEKIVRLTKTMAITNRNTKLQLNIIDDGYCRQIGGKKSIYEIDSNSFYFLETKALKESFLRRQLVSKISRFNFSEITLDQLIEINKIIETKI